MWRTALLSALLLLGGWASARWLTLDFQAWTDEDARRLAVALHPVPVPAVTLQNTQQRSQSLPALLAENDAITIVDFFYSRCESICLSLGSSMQQLQTALQTQPNPGVRLLSISFDGAYDAPAQLQAYARQLGADPQLWQFARLPDPAEQAALLHRLGVVVIPNGRGDYEHNAALLLLDAQGRLLRIFDLAEQQLALDYARHLASQTQPATTVARQP